MTAFTLIAIFLFGLELAVSPRDQRSVDQGRLLYLAHCERCHGSTGIGNGRDSGLFEALPPNLRRGSILKAHSDEELVDHILEIQRLPLELRPQEIQREAADTEALYQFLGRLPSVRWKDVAAGEELYFRRCIVCHGAYGHPERPLPPGIQGLPQDLCNPVFQCARTDAELAVLVRHGKDGMPALVPRLSENETQSLVRYARFLSPGYELYDRFCAVCHGRHGEGGRKNGPQPSAPLFAFDKAYFRKHDPEEVRQSVWHMLRAAKPSMPHFSESLTPTDVKEIVAYLRSLPPLPSESSGDPLD